MADYEIQEHKIINAENLIMAKKEEKMRTHTPFIITLCETKVTEVDIQSFIEAGLRTVRFRIQITKEHTMSMLKMLKTAMSWCCEKYDVSTWPIALSTDIPNACIRSGFLKEKEVIYLQENAIIEITSDEKYQYLCTANRMFIDDPYALKEIKVGTEITISFGHVVMFCVEVIDSKTVNCKVARPGSMSSQEFVCIRGIKHLKPPFGKQDMDLITFARALKADIVTINSIRYPITLKKIKTFFPEDEMPLFVSTICEQEGLDNIDAIIEASDGIILAREFMAHEILNKNLMPMIQAQISAKCQKHGKPFYISGNILEKTLQHGSLLSGDLNDITNAVLQGAGFVLRSYKDPTLLARAMHILNSICKFVEPFARTDKFWRISTEFKIPVNAAEAAVLASALLAKQTGSFVIIVPTVTGSTAKLLSHIAPEAVVITISSNPRVARQLQLYRGVVPIIYDKKTMKNWFDEIDARIQFAVAFGVKNDILQYGQSYVALRKALPTSSFCDHVSIWNVDFEPSDITPYLHGRSISLLSHITMKNVL